MIGRGDMQFTAKLLIIFIILINFAVLAGCKSKKPEQKSDYSITQQDIDLFIKHKYQIDEITAKFDEKLKKTATQDRKIIFEEGKKEINKYLKSNDLNPEIFMRKSKKILKKKLLDNN